VSRDQLTALVRRHFDLTPYGLREMLDLVRPIYQKTAAYGHFGREDRTSAGRSTDKAAALPRTPVWQGRGKSRKPGGRKHR
jgi:S-adenosylmethionine synthetase